MYIKRVELTNIRCFEHIEIDLSSDGGIRKWAVILGDNGVGKTTLLRSIALALGDKESAAALFRDLSGEWVRRGSPDKKGTIRIDFGNEKRKKQTIYTKIVILNDKGRESIDDYKNEPTDLPWSEIFACGYGAARGIFGTRSYSEYRTIDSVYSLFDYELSLQNAELILRRLESSGEFELSIILHSIDQILMLPLGSTTLRKSGICISGPWGEFMPIDSIGDGYRATLAWLVDFLGWAMFHHDSIVSRVDIAGIVLIDELEQHLHPRWQRRIIKLIHEQFPTTQFIATTHSPLCAIGMTDLKSEECNLVVLHQQDDHTDAISKQELPRGKRADQVLTSSLFGLLTTSDDETREKIDRYSKLSSIKRTPDENRELQTLGEKLDKELGTRETVLEQKVLEAVMEVLAKPPKVSKFQSKALEYEAKRQLRKIFE